MPALSPPLPPPDPVFDAAACRQLHPMFDDWLPGEGRSARRVRLEAACRVCRHCPVIRECAALAAALPAPAGVWGGQVWTQLGNRRRRAAA